MPRLVRRRPLAERIKSYLNPLDFLLWVSEEIDTHDWDQFEKDWALSAGIALNAVFLVARANSRPNASRITDDVFGDDGGVPWLSWFASFIVHLLVLFSALNTFYTFYRKRYYRMFEASIDETPATPSAQRVRVDSTPVAVSPLRYIANAVSGSADSRAHPNAQRDVWELAIWDPLPICVRLFCLFSPGHVLAYWLLLPTQVSDPRPSVTIVTTILVTALLSVQMSFLYVSFTRQAKDNAVVHKEVLREYDNKYVHPRTQPLMRDVGTQHSEEAEAQTNNVDTFTPAFIIQRGFKTSPNPNYVNHVDPEGITPRRQSFATPNASTSTYHTPSHLRDASPIVRPSTTSIRQPQFRPTSTSTGDGGSLGIYSHANSPLRKPASTAIDRRMQSNGDFFYKERGTPLKKASSPLKRSSVPGGGSPAPRLSQFSARRDAGRF